MKKTHTLIVSVSACLEVACGGAPPPPDTAPAEWVRSLTAPDGERHDPPEGVRVPPGAEPKMTTKQTATSVVYLVPEMSFEAVAAWYDAHMPFGRPWQAWQWCDGLRQAIRTMQQHNRIYHQPGTTRILGVTIVEERDGNPPAILIVTDESGPC